MLTDVNALADELFAAYKNGSTVVAPTQRDASFDVAAGYAVERELVRRRVAEGGKVVGRKVGFANKALWRIMKLDTIVWGKMYDDTVRFAVNGHAELDLSHMRSAKLEPEIVFGLREAPDTHNADAAATLGAVEWLAIGFEIIDCPYPDWQFQPADFLASFGLHAALIVGEKVRVCEELIPPLVEQLPKFKVRVYKDDMLVEEGSGKNSLRSPALCLAELARSASQAGDPLQPGEVISSGTLTAGHLLAPGQSWNAEVEGLRVSGLAVRTV